HPPHSGISASPHQALPLQKPLADSSTTGRQFLTSTELSAVSGHLLYYVHSLWSSPVLCPQSLVISCTVSAVFGNPLYCVRSLWSYPVLCPQSLVISVYCVPQSLVIPCNMSAVSTVVISCNMSAVSGHLL
ncbi:unnamed protein product, partial [Staurois parvus]